jgi:hypothetical protein
MTLGDITNLPQVTFEVWSSPEDKLISIFDSIRHNGHTLRSFLLAAFESENPCVKQSVRVFYANNGPAAMVQRWDGELLNTRFDGEFATAAANVTIQRSRDELDVLKGVGFLRHPTDSVCQQRIDDFSLHHIGAHLNESAPILSQLLHGITRTPKKKKSFVPTLGAMLLFHHSQKSNYLQTMMGLYLYSLGCPKRVITLLNGACLSVSHQSIWRALKTLTDDALKRVQAAVRS